METSLNAKWIYSIFAASALAVPAFSQVQIYIGPPPPAVRYEVRPPMPEQGFVWVDGYWGPRGGRYVWVPGAWQRPPYPGAYWSHPHYDHYRQGWQAHESHWDREDHDDRHNHWHDDHHDHDLR